MVLGGFDWLSWPVSSWFGRSLGTADTKASESYDYVNGVNVTTQPLQHGNAKVHLIRGGGGGSSFSVLGSYG